MHTTKGQGVSIGELELYFHYRGNNYYDWMDTHKYTPHDHTTTTLP